MTLRQIAECAATILQAEEIAAALNEKDENGDPAQITDGDALALVACVNLAVAEAAWDFPVTVTAEAESRGGIIPLSALGDVASVRKVAANGRAVRFTVDGDGIRTPFDGKFAVTFVAPITDGAPDDEAAAGAGADRQMLAYLAARNFCLVTGRTDEAGVWDQRYNSEAENRRLKRRVTMPRRIWSA